LRCGTARPRRILLPLPLPLPSPPFPPSHLQSLLLIEGSASVSDLPGTLPPPLHPSTEVRTSSAVGQTIERGKRGEGELVSFFFLPVVGGPSGAPPLVVPPLAASAQLPSQTSLSLPSEEHCATSWEPACVVVENCVCVVRLFFEVFF